MKSTAEKIENSKVVLEIEVDQETFRQATDKAFRKVAGKVSIPGFRKGKVPRAIFERHYGKEALYEEALDIVTPEAYFQAIKDNNIEPVAKPTLEVVQLEEDKPVILKATVVVKPEVELGEYTGLKVEKEVAEITDEDVAAELKRLQDRHAKLNTIEEGKVEKGDNATIDFEGFIDDVAFPGGKGENYSLEIGSGSFIPGFEDQLVGVAIGDEVDVNVSFPEDYHATELAGKPAVFKVRVHSVKRKELVPLDDEFAKDVSEFETLEELKKDVLNRLKETAEQEAQLKVRKQVIDQAVANAKVEVPQEMVENRVEEMVANMGQRMRMQGLSLEQYFQFTGTTLEDTKEKMLPEAEASVKVDLVLEAIAKAENIEASEEDLEEEFNKMAKQYNQEASVIRNVMEGQGNLDMIKQGIALEKAIDFLMEKAK
ncbi:MAG: trigger factor [Clostridia bacterium]|nr:trigger factor [Clostridia bacterium]